MSLSMHLAALLPDPRVNRVRANRGLTPSPEGLSRQAAPFPPHEIRQHFAVSTREHTPARKNSSKNQHAPEFPGFAIHSVAPMIFGEPDAADVQNYNPNAAALDELTPAQSAKRAVLYLHGGDFGDTMNSAGWNFIGQFAEVGIRVDIPIQGLLPEHTAEAAIDLTSSAYARLVADHGAENVSVVAIGSGAALALGALIPFLDEDASPANVILIDPWFDFTPSSWAEPDLGRVASYLKNIATTWSAGQLQEPQVNPGVFDQWAKWRSTRMFAFVGGHTQPLRDVEKLEQLCDAAGVELHVTREPGTVYQYPLRRTAEGRRDRRAIVQIAQGQNV